MSSAIGVIVLIFWIVRAMNNSGSSNSKNVRTVSAHTAIGTEVSPALVALFLKFLALIIGYAMASQHPNPIWVYVVHMVAVPATLPDLFLRCVLVPLGLYRIAYWWSRCTVPFGFGKEFRAGAVYYGTLALARAPAPNKQIEWLQKRLPSASANTAVHDTVLALFAALKGDRDTARAMLNSIDVTLSPRRMRCTARDWLIAEAAGRGDWRAVVRRGRRGRHSFRWSYAVARMAERFDQRISPRTGVPPNWLLMVLWLVAPRRRRTLPLLRAALAVPREPKSAATAWPVRADLSGALGDLAGMLLQMSGSGQEPEREHFLAIVHSAVAQVESPQTRAHLQERLKALDPLRSDASDAVETIVRGMHQQLVELVIPIIEKSAYLVEGEADRPVLREAIDRIRQSALQDIEMRCRDYEQRTASETSMESTAEWSAWAVLQERANHVLTLDKGADDALFQTMYGPVCNFAVFQHNVLKRHGLAHDMFSWLKRYSKSNPDADALLARNIKAYAWRWNQGEKP